MFGKLFKILFTVIGSAFLVNSLLGFFFANYTLGLFLEVIVGATLLTYGIFFNKINAAHGPVKWMRNASFCMAALFIAMVLFLAFYGVSDNITYNEDAVIVLGAAVIGNRPSSHLVSRLDAAAIYHEKNPSALIVVSGGKGAQEDVTEASAMQAYLIDRGVDPDVILTEERATSTKENFIFSREILDKYFQGPYTAAFITNDFHIYRSTKTAEKAGFTGITHLHSRTLTHTLPRNYFRECLAVLKLWVLD